MNKLLNKIKGHFKRPELEFNKPLTSADVVKMIKEKQFNGLKKLMPQFNWGKKKLSRWQSIGVLVIGLLGLALLPIHPVLGLMAFGLSIAFGSEADFYATEIGADSWSASSSAVLDSTHIVVGFQDPNDSNKGKATIGVISGTTITFGSAYEVTPSSGSYLSVGAIDATHFVCFCMDWNESGDPGIGIIGTVSNGDEIAFESRYSVGTKARWTRLAMLDSTHFVVSFADSDNNYYGSVVVGVISGSTISFGSVYLLNGNNSLHYHDIAKIDSTHFVVGYKDEGNSDKGTAIIGTVASGDEVSFGSEYVFNDANTRYIGVDLLDSTHFVVAYQDDGGDDYGHAKVGTIANDDEISYGAEATFTDEKALRIGVAVLDSTHIVVGCGFLTPYEQKAWVGTVSGTSITFGDGAKYSDEYLTAGASVKKIDSTHFTIAYPGKDTVSYGRAIFGTYTAPAAGPANVKSWNGVAIANIKSINGISISSIKSINGLE